MSDTSVRSKGFTQVVRTCAAISDAVSEVLDPLSIFALEGSKKESEKEKEKKIVVQKGNMVDLFPTHNGEFASNSNISSRIMQAERSNDVTSSSQNVLPSKYAEGPVEGNVTSDDEMIKFITGEQKIMSLVDASLQTTPGRFIYGTLLMTNYRILFVPKQNELRDICAVNPSVYSWLQIPLACIDRLEKEKRHKESINSGINIIISCKDFRQWRVTIKSKNAANGDYDIERAFNVLSAYAFPNNMRYLFAFSHSITHMGQLVRPVPPYDCLLEFSRMGVLNSNLWRTTQANADFKLCNTYPKTLFVPRNISDDELHIISNFRSGHRLPILCWADKNTNVTMWRSSQPKAGVSGACLQDEKLLDTLARSSLITRPSASGDSKHSSIREPLLHIVDLRSRASAMANRAAGAGYESQANYPNSRLEFYNIPNIHGVRDSLKGLASIALSASANAASDVTFSKQIEDTQWLTNLRLVLKASWESAAFLSRGHPVLVHCSHGWDRTAQVCALAQLLLDPFYRTMEGFRILVEKEWVAFGHPFQMRCCHSQDKQARQEDQVSPIMLQFLDCVWQIQRQHCQYFEFNCRYLLTLADHIYSGRFGTFLFSNEYDRELYNSRQQCADVWTYIHCNRLSFLNPLFIHSASTVNLVSSIPASSAASSKFALLLPPLTQLLRNVTLWSEYFLRWSSVPSLLFAPTVLSKQLYANGLSRQLYFPTSDAAYNSDVELLLNTNDNNRSESKLVEPLSPLKSSANKSVSDLELCSMVTGDDFWEGAFRLEREHRIKLEESLAQTKTSHNLMIQNLRSFLFEKAVDFSELELDRILSGDDVGEMLLQPFKRDTTTVESSADDYAVDVVNATEDDLLAVVASVDDAEERGSQSDETMSSSCIPEDIDDEGGRTTPVPTGTRSEDKPTISVQQQQSFLV